MESYTTPSTSRGACGVENNVRGVCGLLNKGRVEKTRLSSSTLRARYPYQYIAGRSQVMGRVVVRIVREGGVYKQRRLDHPPKSPLEYTTPTPDCSHDTDREGECERLTMTSRNRRDV